MSWNDAAELESKLKLALDTFDWSVVETICFHLIDRIKLEADLIPESSAKRFLAGLRRKQRFTLMSSLADAMMQSGQRSPQIRRQYAQALIDQGTLGAGEMILQSILLDPLEESEARGLMGRIYKQLYVNNNNSKSTRNRANMARALSEYLHGYRLNPYEHLWHGINVVALSERARRDGLPPVGWPDMGDFIQNILAALSERELRRPLEAWDLATRVEAYVSLGLREKTEEGARRYYREAEQAALTYISRDDADAFEIASTIRQFKEVWSLNDKTPPGDHLLPILNAGYLRKKGAAMEDSPQKIKDEAAAVDEAIEGLEAIFGPDRMVTLAWYRKGLKQCDSIARVQRANGKGHGTGWLVKATDFFSHGEGLLLLTNAHVVSDNPNPISNPKAIYPDEARIKFETIGNELYEVEELRWSSPPKELDATFLRLKNLPVAAEPLTIYPRAVEWVKPAPVPRLYIIGHPGGRDLEVSLQDNHLLAANANLLHYRTPTEPGSSGSPVFEQDDWRVVALHHKGSTMTRRFDGGEPDPYEANEGVAILAVRNATRGV